MRAANLRRLLVHCSDYQCSHWTAISGDRWPDEVRLSDIEPRFTWPLAAGAIAKGMVQKAPTASPNPQWTEYEIPDRYGFWRQLGEVAILSADVFGLSVISDRGGTTPRSRLNGNPKINMTARSPEQ